MSAADIADMTEGFLFAVLLVMQPVLFFMVLNMTVRWLTYRIVPKKEKGQ